MCVHSILVRSTRSYKIKSYDCRGVSFGVGRKNQIRFFESGGLFGEVLYSPISIAIPGFSSNRSVQQLRSQLGFDLKEFASWWQRGI